MTEEQKEKIVIKTFSVGNKAIGWFVQQVQEKIGQKNAMNLASDLKVDALLQILYKKGITDENEFDKVHQGAMVAWAEKIKNMPEFPKEMFR